WSGTPSALRRAGFFPRGRLLAIVGRRQPATWRASQWHSEQAQRGRPMKFAWLLSVGMAFASLCTNGWSQEMDFNKVQIITEQLGPNVYMLTGSAGLDPSHEDAAGGRIGVLAGPDGILMIDSQYVQLADKVLAAIKRIDTRPIRLLVNTHIHRDHTAGNA